MPLLGSLLRGEGWAGARAVSDDERSGATGTDSEDDDELGSSEDEASTTE